MMSTRNNIKGFFSYSRQDDKLSSGELSALRKNLESELWLQVGGSIEIFQDQEDISWGEFWKTKITSSLDSSKFLIAIVTPNYLRSEACRFELEYFMKREQIIGSQRILPLLYIDTPELRNTKDEIFSEINNRQWFDWTKLRFSSYTSKRSKQQIEILAKRIRELIIDEISIANRSEANFSIPSSISNTTVTEFNLEPIVKSVTAKKLPTPPENFPKGWDTEWQPSFEDAVIAAKPEPRLEKITSLADIEAPERPSMYVPLTKENKDKDHPPRQLTITLRSTGDNERDRRRIKTLHGLITAQHGRDKFSLKILGEKKGYMINFPNDTTRICPELLARLKKLIGEEVWRVDEIGA